MRQIKVATDQLWEHVNIRYCIISNPAIGNSVSWWPLWCAASGTKTVLYSNAFMAKWRSQTLSLESVADKKRKTYKTFLSLPSQRRVKSEPHQTWHGDREVRTVLESQKRIHIRRTVSSLGGAENLENAPITLHVYNFRTPWANPLRFFGVSKNEDLTSPHQISPPSVQHVKQPPNRPMSNWNTGVCAAGNRQWVWMFVMADSETNCAGLVWVSVTAWYGVCIH